MRNGYSLNQKSRKMKSKLFNDVLDNAPDALRDGVRIYTDAIDLLKEARDLLVMCQLIDKSGQCTSLVDKIDDRFPSLKISENG